MAVYSRANGTLSSRKAGFFPFFFLSDEYYLKGFSRKHWIKELSGEKHFRYLCAFERWSHMWGAVRDVIARFNTGNPSPIQSYTELPVLHLRSDPVANRHDTLQRDGVSGSSPFAARHRNLLPAFILQQSAPAGRPDRSRCPFGQPGNGACHRRKAHNRARSSAGISGVYQRAGSRRHRGP